MFPEVATGAHNPEPGLAVAVMTAEAPPSPNLPGFVSPATGIAANYGADRLAAQIQETLARCRRLGHREPSVTLTRPTLVVMGVEMLLSAAGLAVTVVPARIGGCSVLTVRA